MNGTDATTGKPLAGLAHLEQSIRDILTTPIGSRVMRRDYGSRLFELVDKPLNRKTVMDFYAAAADAIKRNEPRLQVTNISITSGDPGQVVIDLTGTYLPDGQTVLFSGITVT